jgi:DNA-directed RNA polymerase subunit RPC12/RpoP
MINVQCPNCVTPLDFADDRAGTKVHCPHCRQKLLLPMPDQTILAQEIDPPTNLILLPDEPPPLPASDNRPSRRRRFASIKRRSSSFGLGMGGALQFGGLVCLLIAGVLFLRGKTLLAQAQHDRLIAEQMLGAFGGGDFAHFLPPDPRRGDGISQCSSVPSFFWSPWG